MFCSKCGNQISEADQYCPKCGTENINYKAPVDKENTKPLADRKVIAIAVGAGLLVVAVAAFFLLNGLEIGQNTGTDRVSFSQTELTPYIDTDGTIYFIKSGEVISFEGKAKSGQSTPDQTKFVVQSEDGALSLYDSPESDAIEICKKAEDFDITNNKGCIYTVGVKDHVYYYDFEKGESIDMGMEDSASAEISLNGNTMAALDKSGTLSIFNTSEDSSKVLCTAEKEAGISCVADDGSNVIWSAKNGNNYNVYLMKNGAPERIGKITNSQKYSSVFGWYFNNDETFIVYSTGSSQMIVGKRDEAQTVALPGVLSYGLFYSRDGKCIDSDDDLVSEPYFLIKKTKGSDINSLYQLKKDGSLQLEVEGISDNNYSIREGCVYYINNENDLVKKKLGEENDIARITTDVKRFFVPEDGQNVYLVKAGSLYYISLDDANYQLNLIWNGITDDDSINLSDKADTIFFITQKQEIEDSYRMKGTLYKYVIGSEPQQVVGDAMYITSNGAKYPCADYPIIEQYVSHEEYDYVINVGTYRDGVYQELIHSAND